MYGSVVRVFYLDAAGQVAASEPYDSLHAAEVAAGILREQGRVVLQLVRDYTRGNARCPVVLR